MLMNSNNTKRYNYFAVLTFLLVSLYGYSGNVKILAEFSLLTCILVINEQNKTACAIRDAILHQINIIGA